MKRRERGYERIHKKGKYREKRRKRKAKRRKRVLVNSFSFAFSFLSLSVSLFHCFSVLKITGEKAAVRWAGAGEARLEVALVSAGELHWTSFVGEAIQKWWSIVSIHNECANRNQVVPGHRGKGFIQTSTLCKTVPFQISNWGKGWCQPSQVQRSLLPSPKLRWESWYQPRARELLVPAAPLRQTCAVKRCHVQTSFLSYSNIRLIGNLFAPHHRQLSLAAPEVEYVC